MAEQQKVSRGVSTAIISAIVLAALGLGGGNLIIPAQNITVNINQTTGGGGVSEGGCSPFWQCGEWSRCLGYQIRTCTDTNNCPPENVSATKPNTLQACTLPPGTNLYCGDKICGSDESEIWCPDCAYRSCSFTSECKAYGTFMYCIDKDFPPVDTKYRDCFINNPNFGSPNQICVCSALLYDIIRIS